MLYRELWALKKAVLEMLATEYHDSPHPWHEEYLIEEVSLKARDLVRAVNASNKKPLGWED